jgi:predicted nucleic acid-binding protein
MILYLDTSALLKKYFKEVHSEEVIARWKQARAIVTSSVSFAETVASIHRKKRETDFDEDILRRVIDAFQKDWKGFICVDVTNDLNATISRLIAIYPLRGFDAIHLASALMIYEKIPRDFLFACFDQKLLQTAQAEALDTLPAKIS